MTIVEQIRNDVTVALKAGERERAGALRLLVSAIDREAKDGGTSDEVDVLRRERKRRLEAAQSYRDGHAEDRARSEEAEAEMIAAYLPAEMDDAAIASITDEVIAETGATGPGDMGRVMGGVMPRVKGQADGNRVREIVQQRLGA
ncbi:MAG: GatB/YqeY domain-containing protein [Solirubrobacterales bacterium]